MLDRQATTAMRSRRRGDFAPVDFASSALERPPGATAMSAGLCVSGAIPIIAVVDKDAAVRESLDSLICGAGWRSHICASANEFLARPRVLVPGCLVLDIDLPDINGLELQTRVADRLEMPIIFIASHWNVSMAVTAMKAGAVEFLTKPFCNDVLLSAIRRAVDLSAKALRQEAEMQSLRDRFTSLTPREREILELVVRGYLNKQVGGELGISEITVKQHRGKMMRKMAATSLPQLVTMAASLNVAHYEESPIRRHDNRRICGHR